MRTEYWKEHLVIVSTLPYSSLQPYFWVLIQNFIFIILGLLLVGMARAFGVVGHVWKSVRRMAKRILREFKEVSEVWAFLKMAMHFLCFASRCSSLWYSSITAQTSRGSGCILAVFTSVLHQSPNFFFFFIAHITIFCHFGTKLEPHPTNQEHHCKITLPLNLLGLAREYPYCYHLHEKELKSQG